MPAAVPAIMIGVTVASAAIGAAGSIYQGMSQANAAKANAEYQSGMLERNAQIGRMNAETIRRATDLEVQKGQERARALLARQENFYASSGVELEGSPLMVMGETAFQLERDILVKKHMGAWKASLAESGADISSYEAGARVAAGDSQASGAMFSGMWGAGKSLVGGAYNVINAYRPYNQTQGE